MIFTLSIVTRSALPVEIDEFANFSKLRSFLETKLPDISKVTVILEKINSIIDGNKSFRGLPADLFPISFFVLKYFSNFRLPTFFWDLQLPTSFRGPFHVFKKNAKKISILEYNMSEFELFWRNLSEISSYRRPFEISAYRRSLQNSPTSF